MISAEHWVNQGKMICWLDYSVFLKSSSSQSSLKSETTTNIQPNHWNKSIFSSKSSLPLKKVLWIIFSLNALLKSTPLTCLELHNTNNQKTNINQETKPDQRNLHQQSNWYSQNLHQMTVLFDLRLQLLVLVSLMIDFSIFSLKFPITWNVIKYIFQKYLNHLFDFLVVSFSDRFFWGLVKR